MSRIASILVLALPLFATACGPSKTPANEPLPPGTPAGWERVNEPAGEFSVVMPGGAERSVESGAVTWTAKENASVYLVSAFGADALQPSPAEATHQAIGAVAKGCGGEVVEEQAVAEGTIAAVAFAVRCEKGIDAIGVVRTTKAHMYLQFVAARETVPSEERVKLFIASFRPGR